MGTPTDDNDNTNATRADACAHCGTADCHDHCSVAPNGRHRARLGHVIGHDHLIAEEVSIEVHIECAACGGYGHAYVSARLEDIFKEVQWDFTPRRP